MTAATLSTRELADRWVVSAGHLANERGARHWPQPRRVGHRILYRTADVEEYERRRREPAEQAGVRP